MLYTNLCTAIFSIVVVFLLATLIFAMFLCFLFYNAVCYHDIYCSMSRQVLRHFCSQYFRRDFCVIITNLINFSKLQKQTTTTTHKSKHSNNTFV